MRVIVVVALAVLLAGCNKSISPTKTVGDFVEAMEVGKPDQTAKLLNDESQVMVPTNLAVGQGIAWIATEAARSKSGYKLVLEKSTADKASVLLKADWDTSKFRESRFPPQLRQQGVRFYLVKESGDWKIHLLRTEDELFDLGVNYLRKVNNGSLPDVSPLWMPSLPGIPPAPPGSNEKQ